MGLVAEAAEAAAPLIVTISLNSVGGMSQSMVRLYLTFVKVLPEILVMVTTASNNSSGLSADGLKTCFTSIAAFPELSLIHTIDSILVSSTTKLLTSKFLTPYGQTVASSASP